MTAQTRKPLSAILLGEREGKVGRPSLLPDFVEAIENADGPVVLFTVAKTGIPAYAHRRNLLDLACKRGAFGITEDTVRVMKIGDNEFALVADGIAGLSKADLAEIGVASPLVPGKAHAADAKTRRQPVASTPTRKGKATKAAAPKVTKPRARKATKVAPAVA